jgi:hypothetical protein
MPRSNRRSRRNRSAPQSAHRPKAYNSQVPQDQRIDRHTVHFESTVSSSAGGSILANLSMDPSSAGDWADFTALYDEFRVVGVRIHLVSAQTNSTGVNNGILAIAYDDDTNSAPASVTAVRQYATSTVHSTIMTHNSASPLQLVYWRPTTGVPPLWIDVATPSGSLGSILLAATGLTASTAYLQYALDYYVEFRGRR